jgi:hypothetical protein|tara:strand:- start:822 stop:1100 length:279 start_codon:yes stop_codon:yes gene_type:complete
MTKQVKQLFSFLALVSTVVLAFHPLFHDELEALDNNSEEHSECQLCAQLEETVETEYLFSAQTSWEPITDKRQFSSPPKNNLQTFRARSPPL